MTKEPIKVEFGDVLYYFTPTEADEWQHHNGYDYHYCEDYNQICVYKVDDVDKPTSYINAVHVQPISI